MNCRRQEANISKQHPFLLHILYRVVRRKKRLTCLFLFFCCTFSFTRYYFYLSSLDFSSFHISYNLYTYYFLCLSSYHYFYVLHNFIFYTLSAILPSVMVRAIYMSVFLDHSLFHISIHECRCRYVVWISAIYFFIVCIYTNICINTHLVSKSWVNFA